MLWRLRRSSVAVVRCREPRSRHHASAADGRACRFILRRVAVPARRRRRAGGCGTCGSRPSSSVRAAAAAQGNRRGSMPELGRRRSRRGAARRDGHRQAAGAPAARRPHRRGGRHACPKVRLPAFVPTARARVLSLRMISTLHACRPSRRRRRREWAARRSRRSPSTALHLHARRAPSGGVHRWGVGCAVHRLHRRRRVGDADGRTRSSIRAAAARASESHLCDLRGVELLGEARARRRAAPLGVVLGSVVGGAEGLRRLSVALAGETSWLHLARAGRSLSARGRSAARRRRAAPRRGARELLQSGPRVLYRLAANSCAKARSCLT